MKKLDKEFVKQEFEKQGYILLEEYQNCHRPIDLITKDGYKGSMDYSHLCEGTKPILFGKRCKFQKENIKLLLYRKNPNLEFIDCVTKKHSGKIRTLVTIKCTCGNEFIREFSHIQNDKHLLCEKCTRELERQARKKIYNNKYSKGIDKSKYQLVNPTQDLYSNKLTEVIEKDTGFKGFIYPNRPHQKMIVFGRYINRSNYVYNVNLLLDKYGSKTRAIDFVDDSNVKFICECGQEYIASWRSVPNNNKYYCDICTQRISEYELIFKKYLDNIKEEYIREYTFNNCRDITPLPFDFHLTKYDILIEIDGRQHKYDPYTIAHDKIKNEYCQKHNIPLLRIWYEDIQNGKYVEIFEEFIKPFRE